MKLSRRADYSVRAMVDVALASRDDVILTREIAERQDIPLVFLTKIITRLVQADLLRAYRGAKGGIVLARPAEEINLREIVEAVEGPIALNRCVKVPSQCKRDGTCPMHEVWCQAQNDLLHRLDQTHLASLVQNVKVVA